MEKYIEESPVKDKDFLEYKCPDQLVPADSLYSSRLDEAVKLRSMRKDLDKYPPLSIYSMFQQTVSTRPDQPALAYKKDGKWNFYNYLEYWRLCLKASKSFMKLGLGPSECVTIIGFNAPQWNISCLAAQFAGGVSCGIYATNSVEACEHIFKDSKSRIVVVENKEQLDKIIKCIERGQVDIKAIIQYTGKVENSHDGLVKNWSEFVEYGHDVAQNDLNERIKGIAPNKCSTLVYTSGTTGQPKGAMISHDSITFLIRNYTIDVIGLRFFEEKFVSYLPLSHVVAQSIDIYGSIYLGGTTYFAQPDAFKGSLNTTLLEVKPTFFFAVPRVFEKMQDKLETVLKQMFTGAKSKVLSWIKKVTFEHVTNGFNKEASSYNLQYMIAKHLILNRIHAKLGFDQCRTFFCGAAPIARETLEFFISLGIPLVEAFGMSETFGPHFGGLESSNRVTSIGKVDQYKSVKIVNKSDDGSGELCLYGRNIFMGYLNNIEKTEETFDLDGWLHTGDIAKFDDDGFTYITGRLKELIITAGGENIAPVPIENNIKNELKNVLSNCMLIGDKKKYLVVLVTLKSQINLDTLLPENQLTDECIHWLKSIGSKSTKVSDIIDHKDELVYNEIQKGINRANSLSVSRAAKVQKFSILPMDFCVPNGELGPTLKLRRQIVLKNNCQIIENMYKDSSE